MSYKTLSWIIMILMMTIFIDKLMLKLCNSYKFRKLHNSSRMNPVLKKNFLMTNFRLLSNKTMRMNLYLINWELQMRIILWMAFLWTIILLILSTCQWSKKEWLKRLCKSGRLLICLGGMKKLFDIQQVRWDLQADQEGKTYQTCKRG